MHDQCACTPAEEAAAIDAAILTRLLADDAQRPWSVDELAREVGDDIDASDGLARLYRAGLIHRLDEFVFATRPALRGGQLLAL